MIVSRFIARKFLVLSTLLVFSIPVIYSANAATNSPSSKPTSTVTATKKATSKPKYKPKPRKKVKLKPRKDPKWPPAGFEEKHGVYAKIPTARQVLDTASTDRKLRAQLNSKICNQYACGAVMVAAASGCVWWELTGEVVGPKSATDKSLIKLGAIRSLYGLTQAKEIKTILLVSGEKLKPLTQVVNIDAICHLENTTEVLPSNSYKAASG